MKFWKLLMFRLYDVSDSDRSKKKIPKNPARNGLKGDDAKNPNEFD